MAPEQNIEIARQIVDRFKQTSAHPIRRVILFGSRATGTARSDSDFDLLVVEPDPVIKRQETERVRRLCAGFPYPVDAWVMGEQEFQETKNIIGGLAFPAQKYGIVVYENR